MRVQRKRRRRQRPDRSDPRPRSTKKHQQPPEATEHAPSCAQHPAAQPPLHPKYQRAGFCAPPQILLLLRPLWPRLSPCTLTGLAAVHPQPPPRPAAQLPSLPATRPLWPSGWALWERQLTLVPQSRLANGLWGQRVDAPPPRPRRTVPGSLPGAPAGDTARSPPRPCSKRTLVPRSSGETPLPNEPGSN